MYNTSNPQVELPYIYLIAWFVLYCPNLMIALASKDPSHLPCIEQCENFDWTDYFMSAIPKVLRSHQNYQIYHCFSDFLGSNYGDGFQDNQRPNGFTTIFLG